MFDRSIVFLQMMFASEQLYKGYLRRNMPTIVTKVKVREIIPHLPCLTDHDRVSIPSNYHTEHCTSLSDKSVGLLCLVLFFPIATAGEHRG